MSTGRAPADVDATVVVSAEVVIVGLGPVGALLANQLGARGVRVAVFEATTDVHNLPRAAHFDGEVMRIFQGVALADAVESVTSVARGMHFLTRDGRRLFGFDTPTIAPQFGWPVGSFFSQPELERVLRAGLTRFPNVEVRLAHEVVGLDQDDEGVTVRSVAARTGRPVTVHARYVLGCDGARSVVRRRHDIELDDSGFDQPWLVVDFALRRPVPLPDVCQQICDPARPTTFIPLNGSRRRLEFMLLPDESPDAMQAEPAVRRLLSRWVTPDDVDVVRAAVYRFHALVARDWRRERAFLLGDAAHQMPPFLGQGMCAGMRDAANLSWKLAAVLDGSAPESLLDTYQSEREPHVRAITDLAVTLGGLIQTTDPDVARARDERLVSEGFPPSLAALELPPLGPGLTHGEHPHTGRLLPQPRAAIGADAPARLDDILGDGWTVLLPALGDDGVSGLGDDRLARLDAAGVRPVRVTATRGGDGVLDVDGDLLAWLGDTFATFVRPDRYVYAVAREPSDLDGALDALESISIGSARAAPVR